MEQIEKYFNDINKYDKDIYNKNEQYGISNKVLFKIIVKTVLWSNDIVEMDGKIKRTEQQKFRDEIVKRDKKCIVTNFIPSECQACHIIPFSENKIYDINNGLLINSCLHTTFDKFLWSINPDNLTIDIAIDNFDIVGSIIYHKDKKVNIENYSDLMKMYLTKRWVEYQKYKNNYNTID